MKNPQMDTKAGSYRPWAEAIAARIEENVRAMYAKEISFEEFSARNRAAWDDVSMGEPNVIGSACSRRHIAVSQLLG
jgi:hypothetical protein